MFYPLSIRFCIKKLHQIVLLNFFHTQPFFSGRHPLHAQTLHHRQMRGVRARSSDEPRPPERAPLPELACSRGAAPAEPSSSCTAACSGSRSSASWSGAASSATCRRPPPPPPAPVADGRCTTAPAGVTAWSGSALTRSDAVPAPQTFS